MAERNSIPSYTLRVSTRARRVRLQVSARDGLVVIVPKGFARRRIPDVLKGMQEWIQRAMARASQLRLPEPSTELELPQQVHLRAIREEWTIRTGQPGGTGLRMTEQGSGVLLVSGDTGNLPAGVALLRVWLRQKSHERLVPWLKEVSTEQRLPFGRTTVRSQRTRWASCSSRKTISINQNLLFLPGHLVRYVFVHELCHTIHMNHSRDFWALVREREPDFAALRKELRDARQWVPDWVEPRVGRT